MIDSFAVAIAAGLAALILATALAWLTQRTTLRWRAVWTVLIWALLLMPSYLSAAGWQSLLEPKGVLDRLGLNAAGLHAVVFGPLGVAWVLTTKGLPFAYLSMSAAMLGLGTEFEEAARVHGAGRWGSIRLVLPVLAPAMWSGFAIVFAESMGDFGVASTLAVLSHFPVATYTLYQAISSMPIRFPVAAAVAWCLVFSVGLALIAQVRALRDRSYAVLSGRTRPCPPRRLGVLGQALALTAVAGLFMLALGIPLLGAAGAALLPEFGGGARGLTLVHFERVVSTPDLWGPVLLSARLAAVAATCTLAVGLFLARQLSRRGASLLGRILDLALLSAVAMPSIVLAGGYIFAYNLPLLAHAGLKLYGTLTLLGLAYVAAALPATARLLVGPLSQLHSSLLDAARVHGRAEANAWATAILPLLARALLWAWLLTFAHIMFELPISELLYPPGQTPLPVAIVSHLNGFDFAGGSAMLMTGIVSVLVMTTLVLGLFRLFVPGRWQAVRAAA